MRLQIKSAFLLATLFSGLASNSAVAGVFNMPHFVEPSRFALGLEPELILTNGAGFGFNAKYTQGLSSYSNLTGIIGTGEGPRHFRVGGDLAFDLFPDIEGQPGIGIGTQALYYRLRDDGQLEITAVPYIHKAFQKSNGSEFEPFFALPFGIVFTNGTYHAITSLSLGSLFKISEHFQYVLEFQMAINNTDTGFSGGIVYYY